MQICYWCPFLTHIATIDAVKNSAISIKKYSRNNDIKILNSIGEWDFLKKNSEGISVHNLQRFNIYKFLPKEGFFSSRFSFLIIFCLNFIPLWRFVKKEKPDFIIIHLLTILPILLSPLLSKHTKIILRISGLPEMTPIRSFFWKFFSKYIYTVTTPTNLTKKLLLNKNIFSEDKMILLRDPIINWKNIRIKKNEKTENLQINNQFYLSIGRLTPQKNFDFLIKSFAKNLDKFKIKKLIILGSGEEYNNLIKLIEKHNVQNNIFLLGFKKNVFKYINKCSALISTSNYEDPGFAIIEACFLKKKVISSLVHNGPLEMNQIGDLCYFFDKNDEKKFVNQIILSENDNSNKLKILKALKFSKEFTLFSHYKKLRKLIR